VKPGKILAVLACVGLLSAAAMGAPHPALAQDGRPEFGAGGGPSPSAEPDKKKTPEDVDGCWNGADGSLEDRVQGPGIGWIGIDQSGAKIVGSSDDSYYEFLWDDGAFAYGPASGKVTAKGFKIAGDAGGNCKIDMSGRLATDGSIVGSYKTKGSDCKKEELKAAGTFNLPADPTGCVFVTPP
jgi:hypothetical protein